MVAKNEVIGNIGDLNGVKNPNVKSFQFADLVSGVEDFFKLRFSLLAT